MQGWIKVRSVTRWHGGDIYAPAWVNQRPETGKSELMHQRIDTTGDCDLILEYRVYWNSEQCRQVQRAEDQQTVSFTSVAVRLGAHQSDRYYYLEGYPDNELW